MQNPNRRTPFGTSQENAFLQFKNVFLPFFLHTHTHTHMHCIHTQTTAFTCIRQLAKTLFLIFSILLLAAEGRREEIMFRNFSRPYFRLLLSCRHIFSSPTTSTAFQPHCWAEEIRNLSFFVHGKTFCVQPVCVYVRDVCTGFCVSVYLCPSMYVCMCTSVYICVYVGVQCMHAHIRTCMLVFMCLFLCIRVYVWLWWLYLRVFFYDIVCV